MYNEADTEETDNLNKGEIKAIINKAVETGMFVQYLSGENDRLTQNAQEMLIKCGFEEANDPLSKENFGKIAAQVDDIHMSKMLLTAYEKIDAKGKGAVTKNEVLAYLKTFIMTTEHEDESSNSEEKDEAYDEFIEISSQIIEKFKDPEFYDPEDNN